MTHIDVGVPGVVVPELSAGSALTRAVEDACARGGGIGGIEERVRNGDLEGLDVFESPDGRELIEQAHAIYRRHDHVVVRGLPVTEDGASLLVAALAMGRRFRTYRQEQVVKKFRMSPWTQDLSHTTREGDFHTDLNTDPEPPAVTAIQCLDPDPGAPEYGQNRVARLADLLAHLEEHGHGGTARFLRRARVTMESGRPQRWSGTIVDGDRLRYHPATLRPAPQSAAVAAELEKMIRTVHDAALAVSVPFDLGRGDVLFVSNRRALHYRGECSVSFTRFPTEYEARAIFVLHQLDEPR